MTVVIRIVTPFLRSRTSTIHPSIPSSSTPMLISSSYSSVTASSASPASIRRDVGVAIIVTAAGRPTTIVAVALAIVVILGRVSSTPTAVLKRRELGPKVHTSVKKLAQLKKNRKGRRLLLLVLLL
jgi:hypothetical protein